MWIRFLFKAAPRVQSAFEKTNICLLQPSSSDNQYAGHACMSSVQCASGKKAFELEFMKWEVVMAPVAIETHTCEEHIILSANWDTSCDLLIQSACFDLVKNTMVVPIQELKSVMQKQKQVKETKIGSMMVDTQSCQNPDTSHGLYATRVILRQEKLVEEAK